MLSGGVVVAPGLKFDFLLVVLLLAKGFSGSRKGLLLSRLMLFRLPRRAPLVTRGLFSFEG
jgi:hypothetical protein